MTDSVGPPGDDALVPWIWTPYAPLSIALLHGFPGLWASTSADTPIAIAATIKLPIVLDVAIVSSLGVIGSPPILALDSAVRADQARRRLHRVLVIPAAAQRLREIDDREADVARRDDLQRLRLQQLSLCIEHLEIRRVAGPVTQIRKLEDARKLVLALALRRE